MTTGTIERSIIDILSENYADAKREIISNYFDYKLGEYEQHAFAFEGRIDTGFFALFTNVTETETLEEAKVEIAARLDCLFGTQVHKELAKLFWDAGRSIEKNLAK
jgi:hypothetical protein